MQHARCRRLGGDRGEILGLEFLARHRAPRLHAVPVYRRALPLSAEGAAVANTRTGIGCGSSAATACAATSGRIFRRVSPFRASSNSTRRRKAISRCSTSRASPARSAAFRRCWRIVFLPVSSSSIPITARPLRNAEGFCIACARGEAGEAIGRIGTADEGGGRFEGYTDAGETEKKILRDVFAKGDAWFRTGDLMRLDEQGLLPFRRPHRRHLSLEGRERRDFGGQRRRARFHRRDRRHHLRRRHSRHRRPRRHERDRGRTRALTSRRCPPISRSACRPMLVPSSSASRASSMRPRPSSRRRASWRARDLIPARSADPLFMLDPKIRRLCRAGRGDVCADHRGHDPALAARKSAR